MHLPLPIASSFIPHSSYSENAVKVHLWVAICTYLLLAWMKAELKSPLTITEVSKVIEVSILSKTDIRTLLDVPEPLTQNQNVNELLLDFQTKFIVSVIK